MILKNTMIGAALALFATTASAQVLSQPRMSNAVVKAADGTTGVRSTKKQNINTVKALTKAHKAATMQKANYTAQDTLFFESFEEWNGNIPWYPSAANGSKNNWTYSSAISSSDLQVFLDNDQCPTWTATSGDNVNFPYPKHGYYELACFGVDDIYSEDGTTLIKKAVEQNEWLISPTITNINGTNYLIFDICYAPYDVHRTIKDGKETLDLSVKTFDFDVLVTDKTRSVSTNEADYKSVYNVATRADEVIKNTDLNDTTAVKGLQNFRWEHARIPLNEYDGKNIRVAIHYKGMKGGIIIVDAIRVSDMLPTAKFVRPEGSFYMGFSADADYMNAQMVLAPAYTETTWMNYSNTDSKDFKWTYNMQGVEGTSEEMNLNLPAMNPSDILSWPTLVSSNGNRSDSYSGASVAGVKFGGDANIPMGDRNIAFTLGNYDASKVVWYAPLSNRGSSAFGTGGESFWSERSGGYYKKVRGIANIFEKPAGPYVFNQVTQAFNDFLNFGTDNIICTVRRMEYKADGTPNWDGEVLGQTTASELKTSTTGFKALTFTFPNTMVIDDAIVISIEGFDHDLVMAAQPLSQAQNHEDDMGYMMVLLKNADNGIDWIEVYTTIACPESADNNLAGSFCMGMNAVFPYLHSNDGTVFVADTAGETKGFDFNSYWDPDGATETTIDPQWNVTCSDNWLRAVTEVDRTAKKVSLKISAQALPEGVSGRNGTITITGLGCKEVITVLQGDAATDIDNIAAGVSENSETYNISGQLVSPINLKKGIYIKNGKKFIIK